MRWSHCTIRPSIKWRVLYSNLLASIKRSQIGTGFTMFAIAIKICASEINVICEFFTSKTSIKVLPHRCRWLNAMESNRLFLIVVALASAIQLDNWTISFRVAPNRHDENCHWSEWFRMLWALIVAQLEQFYRMQEKMNGKSTLNKPGRRTNLIVKFLLSSFSCRSISVSSSSVRGRGSPFASSGCESNNLSKLLGMSSCFRNAWSSGCVKFSKFWPIKSFWKRRKEKPNDLLLSRRNSLQSLGNDGKQIFEKEMSKWKFPRFNDELCLLFIFILLFRFVLVSDAFCRISTNSRIINYRQCEFSQLSRLKILKFKCDRKQQERQRRRPRHNECTMHIHITTHSRHTNAIYIFLGAFECISLLLPFHCCLLSFRLLILFIANRASLCVHSFC